MMKFALVLLVSLFSSSVFATVPPSTTVPNCYEIPGVIPGQFLIFLEYNISEMDLDQVTDAIYALDLSIVNAIGSDILLVERTTALGDKIQEQAVMAGLENLIGRNVLQITCNSSVPLIF